MKHRAVCSECSWSGDPATLSGAAQEADEHRSETGHDAKVERDLETDGGVNQSGNDLARIADALELQNALLLQLVQERERDRAREHPDPDYSAPSDHSIATDIVDSYGDLYGGSFGWEFDPVSDQVESMGDSR